MSIRRMITLITHKLFMNYLRFVDFERIQRIKMGAFGKCQRSFAFIFLTGTFDVAVPNIRKCFQ